MSEQVIQSVVRPVAVAAFNNNNSMRTVASASSAAPAAPVERTADIAPSAGIEEIGNSAAFGTGTIAGQPNNSTEDDEDARQQAPDIYAKQQWGPTQKYKTEAEAYGQKDDGSNKATTNKEDDLGDEDPPLLEPTDILSS